MSIGNPVEEERFLGIGWFKFERFDGPRYVEAVRGAREMHDGKVPAPHDYFRPFDTSDLGASLDERQRGIPEGWITR